MAIGVVLDTSFLITLADPGRTSHETARQYWRHFTEHALPVFLPTIVVSEFCIRQEIPPEILRACVVLPFNWDDAIQAAELDFSKADRDGESRDALKDDVKIIAQAMVKDAAWIITDDTRSFYKFAHQLTAAGKARFHPTKLEDGFDLAFFDPSGQRQLSFDDEPDESETDGPTPTGPRPFSELHVFGHHNISPHVNRVFHSSLGQRIEVPLAGVRLRKVRPPLQAGKRQLTSMTFPVKVPDSLSGSETTAIGESSAVQVRIQNRIQSRAPLGGEPVLIRQKSKLAGTVEGVNDRRRLLQEIHTKANMAYAARYGAVHSSHLTKRAFDALVTRWSSCRRPRGTVEAAGPRLQAFNVFLRGKRFRAGRIWRQQCWGIGYKQS